MISVRNLTKSYALKEQRHFVFKDVSFDFPPDKNIGILGPNGAGKSTLLRILGGIDHPDSGEIHRNASLSWPLGLRGGFVGHMTGRENCRMICNAYGVKQARLREKINYIKELADIGDYFEHPVAYYSSGMGSRLGFALSMAFDFDYFLIDEVTAVGDGHFKRLAKQALDEKRATSKIIMVSHSMSDLKRFCDVAVLIKNGQVTLYEDFDAAIEAYLPKTTLAENAQSIFKRRKHLLNGAVRSPHAADENSTGLHALIADRFAEVQRALAQREELGGRAEDPLIQAAALFSQLGQPQRALQLIERAIEIDAYRIGFWAMRANVLRTLNQREACQSAIESGLQLDPKHPGLRTTKAALLFDCGNSLHAETEVRAALMGNPKLLHAWLLLAQICIHLERSEDALDALEAAAEIQPENPQIDRLKSQVLFKEGMFQEALAFSQKVFNFQPAEKPPLEWHALATDLLTALEAIETAHDIV